VPSCKSDPLSKAPRQLIHHSRADPLPHIEERQASLQPQISLVLSAGSQTCPAPSCRRHLWIRPGARQKRQRDLSRFSVFTSRAWYTELEMCCRWMIGPGPEQRSCCRSPGRGGRFSQSPHRAVLKVRNRLACPCFDISELGTAPAKLRWARRHCCTYGVRQRSTPK
jgi:hypothetical protein